MLSEMKENVQGTNSAGKETSTQINGLDQKEEINIQPEQKEERRIQHPLLCKISSSLLWDEQPSSPQRAGSHTEKCQHIAAPVLNLWAFLCFTHSHCFRDLIHSRAYNPV